MTQDDIDQFSVQIKVKILNNAKKLSAAEAIGSDLLKEIKIRVPPASVARHSNIISAIDVFAVDVTSIGLRILRYGQISKYRNLVLDSDEDLKSAFYAHIYDMRQNELYTILERSIKTLGFAAILSKNLGGSGESQANKFGKAFRKKLGWRLRERHRIVHAHERPSLSTRILELPKPKTGSERDKMIDVLSDVVVNMIMMLAEVKGYDMEQARNLLGFEYFEEIHDKNYLDETFYMWDTFKTHVELAIT